MPRDPGRRGTKHRDEREFYLRMAIKRRWNTRELPRQIEAAAFEPSILDQSKLSSALREFTVAPPTMAAMARRSGESLTPALATPTLQLRLGGRRCPLAVEQDHQDLAVAFGGWGLRERVRRMTAKAEHGLLDHLGRSSAVTQIGRGELGLERAAGRAHSVTASD